jgi:hypothetical protein
VVGAHDPEPFSSQQGHIGEHPLAHQRVGLHQPPLVRIERPRLAEYAVRNPDLADVVKEEPVLGARVAEQFGRNGIGQLERVALDSLRVSPRPAVLRLERAGKRDNGVFVGVLEQQPLTRSISTSRRRSSAQRSNCGSVASSLAKLRRRVRSPCLLSGQKLLKPASECSME